MKTIHTRTHGLYLGSPINGWDVVYTKYQISYIIYINISTKLCGIKYVSCYIFFPLAGQQGGARRIRIGGTVPGN